MSAPAPTARPALPALTVRGIGTTPVEVPMSFALGTSAAIVRRAPLLLVELRTEEGITGNAYLFGYRPSGMRAMMAVLGEAVQLVAGDRAEPLAIAGKLDRAYRLLGVTGVARMALAAIDVALWDALAIAAGLPLARLLGAELRPVPAYNSNGLGLMPPPALADEALKLIEDGFRAVKLRLGHETLREDLAAMRAVRNALPDEVDIMVDYNQALTLPEARQRGQALESEGAYWLEEPLRHDDYDGYRALAQDLSLPVQLGENFNGPDAMQAALQAMACDFAMPDLARIGGVTGWMRATEIAAAADMPLSSHLFPEVSAHLLAASPTAHWLEWVDWASPLLREPMRLRDGKAFPSERPGNGLSWDEEAIAPYKLA